jgi:hypothetical protein
MSPIALPHEQKSQDFDRSSDIVIVSCFGFFAAGSDLVKEDFARGYVIGACCVGALVIAEVIILLLLGP